MPFDKTYESKFEDLQARLDADPDAAARFAENPLPHLEEAGIPLVPSIVSHQPHPAHFDGVGDVNFGDATATAPPATESGSGSIKVTKHWWGIDIALDEHLTQNVSLGMKAGAIAALLGPPMQAIGIISGGSVTIVCVGLATIFLAKSAQISITDGGHGVHFPISWIQWAMLYAAVPAGPPGVLGAGMVFVHPLRN